MPEESLLPDGIYFGSWGSYTIEVRHEDSIYYLKTEDGIRGFNIAVTVVVYGGVATFTENSIGQLPTQSTQPQNLVKSVKSIETILDDIQEANDRAGGRLIKHSELRKMTVEELLNLLVPNNISFEVNYIKTT